MKPLHILLFVALSLLPHQVLAQSKLLVLGDSLSAGYGIDVQQGWVALLSDELSENIQVVNASVSGETTHGGLARLPALLNAHQPSFVIIELGGNDGLRGQPIKSLQKNLDQLVKLSIDAGAKVLLLGMKIPPNYGKHYTSAFEASFSNTAKKFPVIFEEFFLEGVAGHDALMQSDGIHPNQQAQTKLLDNVLPSVKKLIAP